MARKRIPEALYAPAINALRNVGVKGHVAGVAYVKWQRGAGAEECRYGWKEQGMALDCTCVGCVEKLCFLYFDQIEKKFAAALTPHVRGLD